MYELALLSLRQNATSAFRAALGATLFGSPDRADIPPLWDRLRIQRPIASWTTPAGGASGFGLQLFDWPSFEVREDSLRILWADQEWTRGLARQGASMVSAREHWLLDLVGRWSPSDLSESAGEAIIEIRVEPVLNGLAHAAVKTFWATTAPALTKVGARVFGQFQVSVGPPRPTLVTLVGWKSVDRLHEGWRALDHAAPIRAQREEEIAAYGQPLLLRGRQFIAETLVGGRGGLETQP